MYKFIILLNCLFYPFTLFAQKDKINSLYNNSEFEKCTKLITESLKRKESSPNDVYIYYHYLSEIKRTQENFEEAILYRNQSKPYIQNIENKIHYLNRKGAIFYQWTTTDCSQGDSALFYLNKSLELCKIHNNTEFYINNLNLIATLTNRFLNKPYESLKLFNEGLLLAKKHNLYDLIIQLNTNITIPLSELGKYEEAKTHLTNIIPIIDSLNIPIYKLDLHQKLSTINHELQNYKAEAKSLKQEIALTYKMFNSQKAKNIAELELKYQSQLKDLKNKQLINDANQKNIILWVVISILIISIFIVFIFQNLNKRLNKSNTDLNKSVKLNKSIFSILAHDLKQPIVSLEAMIFLLDKNILSPIEQEQNKALIKAHLKTTSLFIDDMMTWSKLEIDKSNQQKELIAPINLVRNIETLYSSDIKEKKIKINLIENLVVFGNKMLLFIILKNLIHNAIKFCNEETEI